MTKQSPRIALVTGASRGVGKGIAEALGAAGMTVYVSGRSLQSGGATLRGQVMPGSIFDTARAINAAGGQGIAVQCDHADDAQVRALFQRIEQEQGCLDLLVNNVTFIHEQLIDPGPFWEKPLDLVDILDIGLRSAYVSSYYAAPLLLRAPNALIAFVSSFGAGCYMHGPAYGAQKAGVDKLAADMGVDFEHSGVAAISLWLGPQLTDRTLIASQARADQYEGFLAMAETPQFNGRILQALLEDEQLQQMSGQTLVSAELALRYGIQEAGGRQPPSWREHLGAPKVQHPARVI